MCISCLWDDLIYRVESRFLEPQEETKIGREFGGKITEKYYPRETKIGSRNGGGGGGGDITEKYYPRETKTGPRNGGFEKSGLF